MRIRPHLRSIALFNTYISSSIDCDTCGPLSELKSNSNRSEVSQMHELDDQIGEATGGVSNGLSWQDHVTRKRKECVSRTPEEWLLDEQYIRSLDAGPTKNVNLIEINVPAQCGLFSQKELHITQDFSASELVQKLAKREFSALEVTTAFAKRAATAQQLLSCLTEVFYDEALARARMLDEYYDKEGKPFGPLHGLPVSIKDSFCVKGYQTTVGWTSFLKEEPSKHNSALVQILLDLGAVLYVKTNIPQTMMTGDSENNIFGRTLNPQNTSLTAGGSSGGEGSLVAFRGSILGVGTDIAGSIRIPALCCGVYGFKPTTNRIPFGGQLSGAMEGLPGLIPSAGPLAHSLDDVELFMKTVLNQRPDDYDSTAHGVPWLQSSIQPTQKLRIGVIPEEKVFPLHPPIRRTISNAVKALSTAGHEIIHLSTSENCSVSLANRLAFAYYILGPDPSGEHFGPSGEPMVASVAARSNPMFSGPLPAGEVNDVFEKIDTLHQIRNACSDAWQDVLVENKLDVMLAPAAQNTAVPHDTYGWPPYTQIWNVLDYPACVIPFGKASKVDDPEGNMDDDFGPQPRYMTSIGIYALVSVC